MVNIDVPAGVGAPPLDTTRQDKYCRWYLPLAGKTIAVRELLFVHSIYNMLAKATLAVCYMNENAYSKIIIETEFVLSYICTCGLTSFTFCGNVPHVENP